MQLTLPKVCLLLAGIIVGMGIMIAVQRTTQPEAQKEVAAQQTERPPEQNTISPEPVGAPAPSIGPSQAMAPQGGAQPQQDAVQPRMPGSVAGRMMEYEQTASGYPIVTGRRAVDSDANGSTAYGGTSEINMANATNNAAVAVNENGEVVTPEPRPIGRNGLISNPAVDPPSSKGTAYRHAY